MVHKAFILPEMSSSREFPCSEVPVSALPAGLRLKKPCISLISGSHSQPHPLTPPPLSLPSMALGQYFSPCGGNWGKQATWICLALWPTLAHSTLLSTGAGSVPSIFGPGRRHSPGKPPAAKISLLVNTSRITLLNKYHTTVLILPLHCT